MDNEELGAFTLGLIVAALLYLIWRHERFHNRYAATENNSGALPFSVPSGSSGGCCCSGSATGTSGKGSGTIPIGGQSYSPSAPAAYPPSRDVQPDKHWYATGTSDASAIGFIS